MTALEQQIGARLQRGIIWVLLCLARLACAVLLQFNCAIRYAELNRT